jgi:hypothetical protein
MLLGSEGIAAGSNPPAVRAPLSALARPANAETFFLANR